MALIIRIIELPSKGFKGSEVEDEADVVFKLSYQEEVANQTIKTELIIEAINTIKIIGDIEAESIRAYILGYTLK